MPFSDKDLDALVSREASKFSAKPLLPEFWNKTSSFEEKKAPVNEPSGTLHALEVILQERGLLPPGKNLRELTGDNPDISAELVIANLVSKLSENRRADVATLRTMLEASVNSAKSNRALDASEIGFIGKAVAGKEKLLESISNISHELFNHDGAEVEIVLSTEEVSLTNGKTGLLITDAQLTNQGTVGKVSQYEGQILPGQILAHTHTKKNPDYLDTLSLMDILAAIDTNEWVNSKGELFVGLHRFSVISCHEKEGFFTKRIPTTLSIQLYQVNILDFEVLQKYRRLPIARVGNPFVIELK